MKRMISLLLALCLLGSMIPFQAFATENAPPPETVVGEAPTEETCEEQADAEDIDSTVPATVMDEPDDVEAAAVRGLDIDRIEIPTIYLTEGLDGRYEWGYYWVRNCMSISLICGSNTISPPAWSPSTMMM